MLFRLIKQTKITIILGGNFNKCILIKLNLKESNFYSTVNRQFDHFVGKDREEWLPYKWSIIHSAGRTALA